MRRLALIAVAMRFVRAEADREVARPMPPGGPLPALASPECRRSREERVGVAENGFSAALHDWPVGEHDPVEVPGEDAL